MGTVLFGGVWFSAYSLDHQPPHIHGEYAEVEVILELIEGGGVMLALRKDAIRPRNAKRGDVRRVIRSARLNEGRLRELWRETHGD